MWYSYYLFCHNFEKHDELITSLGKFMDKLIKNNKIEKWFFIRYWLGGPHIRVRFFSSNIMDGELLAIEEILKKLNQDNRDNLLKKEVFYQYNKAAKDEIEIQESEYPWFNNGEVVSTEYIQEINRYGGKNLISESEQGFYYSSKMAIKLLQKNQIEKIIISTSIIRYFIRELIENRFVFFRELISRWKETFDIDIQENLAEVLRKQVEKINLDRVVGAVYDEDFDNYLARLQIIKNQVSEQYFWSILISHFHMFHNRLGISPMVELHIYNILFLKEKK